MSRVKKEDWQDFRFFNELHGHGITQCDAKTKNSFLKKQIRCYKTEHTTQVKVV